MATTRKKTVRRPVKKTPAKKRSTKKRVIKTDPVAMLVTPTNPLVEPITPSVETPIKHISEQPANRLKLWLAVSLSMAVIVLVWAYSVSRTVLSSNALTESLAKSNINEFVGSISESFSDLKTTSDTFTEQNETPQTNTTQPNTTELDNLFSDIE